MAAVNSFSTAFGNDIDEPVGEMEVKACADDMVDAIAEAVEPCAESPACVDEKGGVWQW